MGFDVTDRVDAVRAFNRFYTPVIGLLHEGLLDSPYSLTESRVIFELARRDAAAADLRRTLDLDAGYLSRLLARFEADGLIARERAAEDARRQIVRLTGRGREVAAELDDRSAAQIGELLGGLTDDDQCRLTAAMTTIQKILGDRPHPASYVLRPLAPGDLGWIVHRHGALYNTEYGYDTTFEALVARVVADYADSAALGEKRQEAWIAEVDGEPVGCIFCTRKTDTVAQLRLLFVEPSARGLGVGRRLVEECVRFARRAGYAEMVLWTHDSLAAARHIYQAAGFQLAHEEKTHDFGHHLTEQTWRLVL